MAESFLLLLFCKTSQPETVGWEKARPQGARWALGARQTCLPALFPRPPSSAVIHSLPNFCLWPLCPQGPSPPDSCPTSFQLLKTLSSLQQRWIPVLSGASATFLPATPFPRPNAHQPMLGLSSSSSGCSPFSLSVFVYESWGLLVRRLSVSLQLLTDLCVCLPYFLSLRKSLWRAHSLGSSFQAQTASSGPSLHLSLSLLHSVSSCVSTCVSVCPCPSQVSLSSAPISNSLLGLSPAPSTSLSVAFSPLNFQIPVSAEHARVLRVAVSLVPSPPSPSLPVSRSPPSQSPGAAFPHPLPRLWVSHCSLRGSESS